MEEAAQSKCIGQKYRLVSPLGQGAMGVVYRAEQLDVEGHVLREVALKMLRSELSRDPEFARRFLREVRITARLRNPHTVIVYDSGVDEEGQLYYTMEMIQGRTLKELLRAQAPLPVERVVKIVGQICEALAEAHSLPEPVVHRDIKPANIFLEKHQKEDWVKVGDFGIAKILGEETSGLSHTGASPGTPRYMAPEQWRGQEADGRADLYALGIMLYEMLTGESPFVTTDGPLALMYQHLQNRPRPLPPSIPAGIGQQVERLLAKTPQERPANALLVRQALEAALAREEDQATIILQSEARTSDQSRIASEVAASNGSPAGAPSAQARISSAPAEFTSSQSAAPSIDRKTYWASPYGYKIIGGLILLVLVSGGLWYRRSLKLSPAIPQQTQAEAAIQQGQEKQETVGAQASRQQDAVGQEKTNTDLILAARSGSMDLVQTLLSQGTNVNVRDNEDRTALMWTAGNGATDLVQFLLSKGADVNTKDKEGKTALLWATSRIPDKYNLVQTLAETVQVLLTNGADISAVDKEGKTALLWAASNGYADIVRILLAKDVAIDVQDEEGKTALLWAVNNDHLDVVRILLAKGAAVNMPDEEGKTALMAAASAGYLDIARALLAKDVDLNYKDNDGRTALMWAVNSGSPEIVQVLMTKGADVTLITKGGRTALMIAALKGQASILEVLLTKGAEINATDEDGKTALMWAVDQVQPECVQILLSKGAAVNITDKGGKNALIWAAAKDYLDAEVERASTDIVQALLAKGADLRLKSDDGRTALLWAAEKGHPGIVRLLLAKKADVQVKDRAGKTALMLATSQDHTEIVDLLRAAGAQG